MKTGLTLPELAAKIDRQAKSARDFLAKPTQARFETVLDGGIALAIEDGSRRLEFAANDVFHEQIREHVRIPADYYRRLRSEEPELLATNVNTWLHKGDISRKRMFRTIDDDAGRPTARAFLTDKYRPLDNYSLANVVLPILARHGVNVESAQITDKRLYIKAVDHKNKAEVKVGEVVSSGIAISNSEVGFGFLKIEPLIYTLRCTNGMIMQDQTLRQSHVGRRQGDLSDEIQHLLTNEAHEADDRAFFLKVRDVAEASLNEVVFRRNVERLREAARNEIQTDKLDKVVEVTGRKLGFTQDEQSGILAHLIRGGDLTQWGLCSAVTRYSQDVVDYDRATELEYAGNRIVELKGQDWDRIAKVSVN